MVADKLVEVCLRDGGTQWVLIHIEIQAQREGSFGSLPKTIRNKLDKASLQQLEAWSDAMVEAQSLRQVFR